MADSALGLKTLHAAELVSPLGPLLVVVSDAGLHGVEFRDAAPCADRSFVWREHALHARAARQLDEYFAGARQTFDLPLLLRGTRFQEAVWRALQEIPYGKVRTYDDIARAVGKPGAQRAVGRANGANPIAIVVPCHRVIRSDGAFGGYGGGAARKRFLLDLENPPRQATFA